jgi:hypothetical protein
MWYNMLMNNTSKKSKIMAGGLIVLFAGVATAILGLSRAATNTSSTNVVNVTLDNGVTLGNINQNTGAIAFNPPDKTPTPTPPVDASKKLLLFEVDDPGSTTPTEHASYFSGNVAEIDSLPYDGIFFDIPSILLNRGASIVPLAQLKSELAPVKQAHTQLTKVADNFVYVRMIMQGSFASMTPNVTTNMANLAEAGLDAGIKGVAFDNEDYNKDMWDPAVTCPGSTLADCQAIARQSGQDVMAAMIAKWPNITLISMLGPVFSDTSSIVAIIGNDPVATSASSQILGAFVLGMNNATIGTSAQYVDGGELGFYQHGDTAVQNDYNIRKYTFGDNSPLITTNKIGWKLKQSVGYGLFDEQGGTPTRWQDDIRSHVTSADQYVWAFSRFHNWVGPPPPSGNAQADASWIAATKAGRVAGGLSEMPL